MKALYLLVLPVSVLLSSCLVFHDGAVSSGPVVPNSTYVDIAQGTTRAVFVFGIGKIERKDLVLEARKKMYQVRPLGPDEYYANFTTAITNKFIFGIVHIAQLSVSADVLKSTTPQFGFDPGFKGLVAQPLTATAAYRPAAGMHRRNGLAEGDSVYYAPDSKNYRLYKVSSVDKENVMLLATDDTNKNMLVPAGHTFFDKNRCFSEFKYGDRVQAEIRDAYNNSTYLDGIVLGSGNGTVLVRTEKACYEVPPVHLKKR